MNTEIMNFDEMSAIEGGGFWDDAQGTLCGISVGMIFVVPGPWSVGAALAICLSGDTSE